MGHSGEPGCPVIVFRLCFTSSQSKACETPLALPSGTACGQPAIPGADWVWEDTHCGSSGGDTVRGPAVGDQGGLRRVSALARDCQVDWLAAGVPGAPGDAPVDHAGGFGAVSHGEAKAELSVV